MAEKVVVYITRGGELLIFDHLEAEPDIPMPQVPKGTLEPGEDPLAGALREAWEETGLKLSAPLLLGSVRRSYVFRGQTYEELFHYVWLAAPATTPDAWKHTVSRGELDQGFVYHHRFVPLEGLTLPWDLDLLLPELRARLVRERVVCYITRGKRELLVFEHDDASLEAGLQVVAGGIEPGETPEQAAVREAWEEAGLRLENPRFLGTLTFDRPPSTQGRGKPEAWHFFWLEAPADTPNAWKHTVLNGEEDAGLVYHQRFVPLEDVRLDWNLDAKLETLRSSPAFKEQL